MELMGIHEVKADAKGRVGIPKPFRDKLEGAGITELIVTTNLFGDILSDEAAGLVGGLGIAPSGNIGDGKALFEPVHGSAPDIAGRGIANPTATFLAVAMLLDYIGEGATAQRVRHAVDATLRDGVLTPDLGGCAHTEDVVKAVVQHL